MIAYLTLTNVLTLTAIFVGLSGMCFLIARSMEKVDKL
jgi:hypothetical protein